MNKTKLRELLLHYNHILHWQLGHYKAYFNRQETIDNYLKSHKIKKLQLGCGPYCLKGWLNTELYGSEELVPLNLLKKFPIDDNKFDFVFSEHVIEHFTLEEGYFINQETFRVLKPGGVVRFATPDLGFLVDLYKNKKTKVQKEYINWSFSEFLKESELNLAEDTFVINKFVRSWGHSFIYDFKSMKFLLKKIGFTNIKKSKPGESKHKFLKNIEHHWKDVGHAFNNLETLVIEAQKPLK